MRVRVLHTTHKSTVADPDLRSEFRRGCPSGRLAGRAPGVGLRSPLELVYGVLGAPRCRCCCAPVGSRSRESQGKHQTQETEPETDSARLTGSGADTLCRYGHERRPGYIK